MSNVDLFNENNLNVINILKSQNRKYNFIYADMIYEDGDFSWIKESSPLLGKDGVYIVQTDYHTVAELKLYMDSLGWKFINWCIYVNDWGGTPKKGFPRKHDDILIYCNGDNFKWYPDRIQIPKATAGTKLDKKGTGTKTPPDVFYDHASFSTMAKERVKFKDKNIQWQKPVWLMERLLLPFTDEGDYVLDLYMGSGTLGDVCVNHNRHYTGIELYTDIFNVAKTRIFL